MKLAEIQAACGVLCVDLGGRRIIKKGLIQQH